MSDLDKLEEVLEKKIKTEPSKGISRVGKLSFAGYFLLRLRLILSDFLVWVQDEANRHKIIGSLLGFSFILGILITEINTLFGAIFIVFMLIYAVLSYPEILKLLGGYFNYVVFGLARRGALVSIATPKEITKNLKSVEFVLLLSVWGLPLSLFDRSVIATTYTVIASILVGLTSVAYYYLSMAKKCWEDPFKRITEADLFSIEFLLFAFMFVASLTNIYLLVSIGYTSIFSWLVIFLTYLFLSAIIAIPSFQAAIFITVKWRQSGIQSLISELMSKV